MKNILPGLIAFFAGIFSSQAQDLYTTTFYGGDADAGTIIKFTPATNNLAVLKNFDNTNGANPYGTMIQANDGKLYGMASIGGTGNYGIIFSFNPSSLTYTKLKDFDSINGANPHGSLMQASNGKLYGMTYNGGSKGYGVIFSFDPVTATYTKLKDFNYADGANPSGSLLQATDGKLYGMTDFGGRFALADKSNWGVIFSFDPSTSVYTDLKDFNDDIGEGAVPSGNLIQASNGKLYGMTQSGGGYGYTGVIFSFNFSSSTYTRLWGFDNTTATGNTPSGSLMQAGNGKLYGLTTSGLAEARYGVIFSYDLLASAYRELHDFDNANGMYPYGSSLLQAGDGKLYGGTLSGGANGDGVIFSYDPASSLFTNLLDFNGTNGAHPYSTFIEVKESGPLPVTIISFTGKNMGNHNVLVWKVENEQDLKYYELQRSIDGQNFKEIAQIKAVGNKIYTYNDNVAATPSLNYYRLKSVDRDRNFSYSSTITLRSPLKRFLIASPNPFKDKLVVSIQSSVPDKAIFLITDGKGRQLYKENRTLSAGVNIVEIKEAGRLPQGMYLLTIIQSQQTQSIKVVKGN